ncbi:MAG TPA: ROK family protein [Ignavibacteriales bacterium]|nr:ROK family protein [Ignavibacteriales bacterium]HOL81140.1 ROK family protein [Ignavibacteriales bacterium]HOM65243.1 ROK family protein [Ignavibacteriales bacterium]HPD66535.1 ROK family protein [Ignavibacteriales bacterium]HPP33504.1 ROK family protein [Ignavibacteriales bacterium]
MGKQKLTLGIDLGGTFIKLGLVDAEGQIVQKISVDTCANEGINKVFEQIEKGVKEITTDNKIKLEGIGIGVPGLVSDKGEINNPPNLPGWGKVPVKEKLERILNYPVFVENDANAAAIGELIYGASKNLNNFIMLTIGTGVGGGIIINRKIFRGEIGAAGELGHVTVDYKGNRCNCGNIGCVESYVGNNYLVARVKKQLENNKNSLIYELCENNLENLTPKIISQAAHQGDDFANKVIIETGNYLGVALVSIMNVLDIATVIVGGGLSGFGDTLFKSIEDTIKDRIFSVIGDRVKVIPAALKNDAGILGAAALVHH